MSHDFHPFSSTVRLLFSNCSRSTERIRYSLPILMAGSFFFRIQSQTVINFTLYLSATSWQFRYFSKIPPPILFGLYLCLLRFYDILMLSIKVIPKAEVQKNSVYLLRFSFVYSYYTTEFRSSQELLLLFSVVTV